MPPSSPVTQTQLTAWPDSWSRASSGLQTRGPRQPAPGSLGCPSSPQWSTISVIQPNSMALCVEPPSCPPATPSPTSGVTLSQAPALWLPPEATPSLLVSERCPLPTESNTHTLHSLPGAGISVSPNVCPSPQQPPNLGLAGLSLAQELPTSF